MKKRGQVTAFIILGLVLLLSVAAFFIVKQTQTEDQNVMEPHIDEAPDKYKIVQQYVLNCIEDVSKTAVKKAGEHGGYVSLDSAEKSFDTSLFPTDSDVVYFGENHPVPYYWYMESDNNCMDCGVSTQKIPSLESIEKQLGDSIDNNLDSCLKDMQGLKEKGYNMEVDKPKTEVHIINKKIIVQTNYPMEASLEGTDTTRLEDFGVSLDVPFLRSYLLAVQIAMQESSQQYLETLGMTLVSYYSGLDSSKLPPIMHLDESKNTVTWVKSVVKQKFKDLLSAYIPLFRVENTANGVKINSAGEYQNALFKQTLLKNNISMDNSTIDFFYLDWPIHFDITPSSGEILEPSSFKSEYPFGMIPATQTNHYEFFYDFSFPVVVNIRNDQALKGMGFDFMFALEGNVRDNKNLLRWYQGDGTIGPWNDDKLDYNVNENALPDATDEELERLRPTKSLMCDDNQLIAGPVDIKVTDSYIAFPVEDVSATFKCGTYENCDLGSTDEEGKLFTKIPMCTGGGIVLEKEGYRSIILKNITAKINDTQEFDLTMQRLREKKVRVKKVYLSSLKHIAKNNQGQPLDILANESLDLLGNEKVTLNLKKRKSDYYENGFNRALALKGNETRTLDMLPGQYEINANLIYESGVVTENVNKTENGHEYTIPSVDMTPVMNGGLRFNSNTGYWRVTKGKLNKDLITFYVIVYPLPQTIEDIEYMGNIEKHSKKFNEILDPVFSDTWEKD
ncbi:MAG: hypothetical protein ACQESF_05800 [Nanobdellota archaeon]